MIKRYYSDGGCHEKEDGDLCFYSDLLPILKENEKLKEDLKAIIDLKQEIALLHDQEHFKVMALEEENEQLKTDKRNLQRSLEEKIFDLIKRNETLKKDREELIKALDAFVDWHGPEIEMDSDPEISSGKLLTAYRKARDLLSRLTPSIKTEEGG